MLADNASPVADDSLDNEIISVIKCLQIQPRKHLKGSALRKQMQHRVPALSLQSLLLLIIYRLKVNVYLETSMFVEIVVHTCRASLHVT
ncbi:hypothetical protein PR048_004858 [Dryococelus australis]|uniref:Uncharacterized protein n=1 Tax=Dryococelus australis TaxID=614101 RepID=A0ABQ9I6K5_9NEOP|nr:hypothetical protein PR048_004858 [Dryococelus australis]